MTTTRTESRVTSRSVALRVASCAALMLAPACAGPSFVVVDGGGASGTTDTGVATDASHTESGADAGHHADAATKDASHPADAQTRRDGTALDARDATEPDDTGVHHDAAADTGSLHDTGVTHDTGVDAMKPCTTSSCTSNVSCPAPTAECEVATCTHSCCGTMPSPMGSTCGASTTMYCDGKGGCFTCVESSECAPSQTKCVVPKCTATGTCTLETQGEDTSCDDNGGTVCNAVGQCVPCTANDATGCGSATPYCLGNACVQCRGPADCTLPNLSCVNGMCQV